MTGRSRATRKRKLSLHTELWSVRTPFRISGKTWEQVHLAVCEIEEDGRVGRGEGAGVYYLDDEPAAMSRQIVAVAPHIESGISREQLLDVLPAGGARNAVDCALWDLEAKQGGRSVADLAGVRVPVDLTTAVTISLDAPAQMAEAAARVASAPLIKVKVNADAPLDAVRAVRGAAPDARLIVDPNEGWSVGLLRTLLPGLADLDVALLEQPVPAGDDAELSSLRPEIPICADEAAHVGADLERIAGRYQAVNIKLDKTGGLTEALAMIGRAREMGFIVMVGFMVSTSLSIAPALLLAEDAAFVDLDGPWWLAHDRGNAMRYEDGRLFPPLGGWGAPA